MHIESILEHNRDYVAGRESRPLPPVEPMQLAVVACYDPRLDALLLPSLGLAPGESFLFRTAGALLRPDGTSLRSLMMAVFMFGVREILVVGHTSCRMAQFETAGFIDIFSARKVPREAFGAGDLGEWAGAIPTPARGVETTIANVLAAPYAPPDLRLAGMVLDDASGELQLVVPPGARPRP